jgi:heat shock protein HtpX
MWGLAALAALAKRAVLFFTVNILVLLTVSITVNVLLSLFGVQLGNASGILLLYSAIGMGGAFISLALSRIIAKTTLGVRVIDPASFDPLERQLVDIVYSLARKAHLSKMPEVGIYESPEVNAFATGPSKSRALVAVSTGILQQMNQNQIEGVLGHELTHVANGDMVTMTLVQGVINTLVLVFARIIAIVISNSFEERSRQTIQILLYYSLQIALSLLGSIMVNYFSRRREFRADAGGARLAGRDKMIGALKALSGFYGVVDDEHQALATLKISGHSRQMVSLLFSTHPPLEERIRRLEQSRL